MIEKTGGRRVDFGRPREGKGLSWGIEIGISIDETFKEDLLRTTGIIIPEHINTIRFLDFNPQETLPRNERNINIDIPDGYKTSLIRLTDNSSKSSTHLQRLFFDVLGRNEKEIKMLNKELEKRRGKEILIIDAHGGYENYLGEDSNSCVMDEETGRIIQEFGNIVEIEDVLKRYDDPDTFSAILLHACSNKRNPAHISPLRVPVVRAIGDVGGGLKSRMGKNPVQIFIPRLTSG